MGVVHGFKPDRWDYTGVDVCLLSVCQTGICGPVLDVMIDVAADYPDLQFIHAEVYTDNTATNAAPAVSAPQGCRSNRSSS